KSQSATGEVTGEKTNIAQNIDFKGVEFKGFKCESTKPKGDGSGEDVKVNELNGNLGIEKTGETKAKDKAANRFVPKVGTTFTEFECGPAPIIVRGAVLNPITSNAMKGFPTPATVKFTGAKGKQKPSKFVGGPEETLESSIEKGPFEK